MVVENTEARSTDVHLGSDLTAVKATPKIDMVFTLIKLFRHVSVLLAPNETRPHSHFSLADKGDCSSFVR